MQNKLRLQKSHSEECVIEWDISIPFLSSINVVNYNVTYYSKSLLDLNDFWHVSESL